jgi:hypothetical protein
MQTMSQMADAFKSKINALIGQVSSKMGTIFEVSSGDGPCGFEQKIRNSIGLYGLSDSQLIGPFTPTSDNSGDSEARQPQIGGSVISNGLGNMVSAMSFARSNPKWDRPKHADSVNGQAKKNGNVYTANNRPQVMANAGGSGNSGGSQGQGGNNSTQGADHHYNETYITSGGGQGGGGGDLNPGGGQSVWYHAVSEKDGVWHSVNGDGHHWVNKDSTYSQRGLKNPQKLCWETPAKMFITEPRVIAKPEQFPPSSSYSKDRQSGGSQVA